MGSLRLILKSRLQMHNNDDIDVEINDIVIMDIAENIQGMDIDTLNIEDSYQKGLRDYHDSVFRGWNSPVHQTGEIFEREPFHDVSAKELGIDTLDRLRKACKNNGE